MGQRHHTHLRATIQFVALVCASAVTQTSFAPPIATRPLSPQAHLLFNLFVTQTPDPMPENPAKKWRDNSPFPASELDRALAELHEHNEESWTKVARGRQFRMEEKQRILANVKNLFTSNGIPLDFPEIVGSYRTFLQSQKRIREVEKKEHEIANDVLSEKLSAYANQVLPDSLKSFLNREVLARQAFATKRGTGSGSHDFAFETWRLGQREELRRRAESLIRLQLLVGRSRRYHCHPSRAKSFLTPEDIGKLEITLDGIGSTVRSPDCPNDPILIQDRDGSARDFRSGIIADPLTTPPGEHELVATAKVIDSYLATLKTLNFLLEESSTASPPDAQQSIREHQTKSFESIASGIWPAVEKYGTNELPPQMLDWVWAGYQEHGFGYWEERHLDGPYFSIDGVWDKYREQPPFDPAAPAPIGRQSPAWKKALLTAAAVGIGTGALIANAPAASLALITIKSVMTSAPAPKIVLPPPSGHDAHNVVPGTDPLFHIVGKNGSESAFPQRFQWELPNTSRAKIFSLPAGKTADFYIEPHSVQGALIVPPKGDGLELVDFRGFTANRTPLAETEYEIKKDPLNDSTFAEPVSERAKAGMLFQAGFTKVEKTPQISSPLIDSTDLDLVSVLADDFAKSGFSMIHDEIAARVASARRYNVPLSFRRVIEAIKKPSWYSKIKEGPKKEQFRGELFYDETKFQGPDGRLKSTCDPSKQIGIKAAIRYFDLLKAKFRNVPGFAATIPEVIPLTVMMRDAKSDTLRENDVHAQFGLRFPGQKEIAVFDNTASTMDPMNPPDSPLPAVKNYVPLPDPRANPQIRVAHSPRTASTLESIVAASLIGAAVTAGIPAYRKWARGRALPEVKAPVYRGASVGAVTIAAKKADGQALKSLSESKEQLADEIRAIVNRNSGSPDTVRAFTSREPSLPFRRATAIADAVRAYHSMDPDFDLPKLNAVLFPYQPADLPPRIQSDADITPAIREVTAALLKKIAKITSDPMALKRTGNPVLADPGLTAKTVALLHKIGESDWSQRVIAPPDEPPALPEFAPKPSGLLHSQHGGLEKLREADRKIVGEQLRAQKAVHGSPSALAEILPKDPGHPLNRLRQLTRAIEEFAGGASDLPKLARTISQASPMDRKSPISYAFELGPALAAAVDHQSRLLAKMPPQWDALKKAGLAVGETLKTFDWSPRAPASTDADPCDFGTVASKSHGD